MADGSATNTDNASGETANNSIVGWRDANATVGALDMFNTSSSASASTGDIILGDVISGQSNSGKIGLFKLLLLTGAGLFGFYLWKRWK
ncbi:MAG: hypothetical protein ACI4RJ_01740 [Alphaproteobacteria bacterium]